MIPSNLRTIFGLSLAFSVSGYADRVELLSLHSSVRQALRKNPELLGEQESIKISEAQVRRELAEFGWGLEALARYEDRSKPQNTREFVAVGGVQLPGNQSRIFIDENFTSRIGVKRRFYPGTSVEFGSRFSRLENTLNRTSASALFSPEYETFTGVTITQPLLKGFGKDVNMAGIKIAKHRVAAQEVLTQVKAMNLAAEVASRYTDIVTADRVLNVHRKNISLAEKMLERNRGLYESNEGTITDVTTAELALYQRQDQFITAAADKVERVNSLFSLIDRGPDLDGETRFKPSGRLFSSSDLNTKRELIAYGKDRRLDVVYYKLVLETAKLNMLRAVDSGKPEVNLTGTAGVYGLSDGGDGAYRNAADTQGTEWSLGLSFKMDFGSDGANAVKDVARSQVRQAELELSKARRVISLEVDTAFSRVNAANQRIATARKAVQLAEERLQQEQDLFDEGEGDFYRVVEQQQILGDSRVNLVASEAALAKSVIAVWLASGQIFDRLGISPAEVEAMILRNKEAK